MKVKKWRWLLVAVGVILAGLVGEARAEVPVWLKKSKPGKFMIDTVDRSSFDIGKFMTYNKHTSQYYYRSEWRPTYTGETYYYSMSWAVAGRYAPSYKTNLAYLYLTGTFTPKQYTGDVWWGYEAYMTKSYNLSLDAYWKLYQQWSLRTYFTANQSMQEWNHERVKQVKHVAVQGTGTQANPYRNQTEEEWKAGAIYGIAPTYDYNSKSQTIGIGLKWSGKAQ